MDGFGNNDCSFFNGCRILFLLLGKLKYQWVHFSFLFDLFLAGHTYFKATDDPTVTTLKKSNACQPLPQSFLRLLMFNLSLLGAMTQQGYCNILSPLTKNCRKGHLNFATQISAILFSK